MGEGGRGQEGGGRRDAREGATLERRRGDGREVVDMGVGDGEFRTGGPLGAPTLGLGAVFPSDFRTGEGSGAKVR